MTSAYSKTKKTIWPASCLVFLVMGLMLVSSCAPIGQKQTAKNEKDSVRVGALNAPLSETGLLPAADGVVRVALLLPLSGQNAALGGAMLNAAQLAIHEMGNEKIELLPRDVGDSPATAAVVAQQVMNDGAQLIIGPLTAASTQAVKPIAAARNIPILSFSTDINLADGQNIYVFGFLPTTQVSRVLSYASARGVNRVAVFAPQDAYGDVVVAGAVQAASRQQTELVTTERYGVATGVAAEQAQRVARTAINGVLLPEGGNRLQTMAQTLTQNGINPSAIKFMGTGLWDDPQVMRHPSLQGGWYAAPDPAKRQRFVNSYVAMYNAAPPRLASLAYDATALAAILIRQNAGQPFAAANLTNPNGFAGVDGLFRLAANGLIERRLAVVEIANGATRVVDAAPTGF